MKQYVLKHRVKGTIYQTMGNGQCIEDCCNNKIEGQIFIQSCEALNDSSTYLKDAVITMIFIISVRSFLII